MYVFFVLVGRWYGTEGLGVFGLIQTGTQIAMYLALLGMGTLIVRRVGEIR